MEVSTAYVGRSLCAQDEGVCRGMCHERACQRIEGNVCILGHSIAAGRRYLRVTKGLLGRITGCIGSRARCPVSCSFGAMSPVSRQSQLSLEFQGTYIRLEGEC